MLAQRAASEGPRWTRAVEDPSDPIPERQRASLEGTFISLNARSGRLIQATLLEELRASLEGSFRRMRDGSPDWSPVLAEAARSECAPSMRAVGDQFRLPAMRRYERAWRDHCKRLGSHVGTICKENYLAQGLASTMEVALISTLVSLRLSGNGKVDTCVCKT